jgi:hypothetical protein
MTDLQTIKQLKIECVEAETEVESAADTVKSIEMRGEERKNEMRDGLKELRQANSRLKKAQTVLTREQKKFEREKEREQKQFEKEQAKAAKNSDKTNKVLSTKETKAKDKITTEPKGRGRPKVVNNMPTQNGVQRPMPETKAGQIWEVADGLSANYRRPVEKVELIDHLNPNDFKRSSVNTAYSNWRKFYGLSRANAKGA